MLVKELGNDIQLVASRVVYCYKLVKPDYYLLEISILWLFIKKKESHEYLGFNITRLGSGIRNLSGFFDDYELLFWKQNI